MRCLQSLNISMCKVMIQKCTPEPKIDIHSKTFWKCTQRHFYYTPLLPSSLHLIILGQNREINLIKAHIQHSQTSLFHFLPYCTLLLLSKHVSKIFWVYNLLNHFMFFATHRLFIFSYFSGLFLLPPRTSILDLRVFKIIFLTEGYFVASLKFCHLVFFH